MTTGPARTGRGTISSRRRSSRQGCWRDATGSMRPRAHYGRAAELPGSGREAYGLRALTQLFWSNVGLHGTFERDLDKRLNYERGCGPAHAPGPVRCPGSTPRAGRWFPPALAGMPLHAASGYGVGRLWLAGWQSGRLPDPGCQQDHRGRKRQHVQDNDGPEDIIAWATSRPAKKSTASQRGTLRLRRAHTHEGRRGEDADEIGVREPVAEPRIERCHQEPRGCAC